MTEDQRAALLEKANALPLCAGVYIMKNASGKVIYVGKSRKLKNRVSQYFQNGEKNLKTFRMVSSVHEFDYIVCNTEIEALTLENSLIKKYNPKYNIKLKDAKSYPYIKVTAEEYPRVLFTRSRQSDKAKYFGPYTGTATVFSVLSLLHKDFGIPSCNRRFPRDIGKERPCIYYQMKQCCGLCTGEVSKEEYAGMIHAATELLRGNSAKVRRELEEKMYRYSENEQYELAMRYRNTIRAIESLSQKQKVVSSPEDNYDIFGMSVSEVGSAISVLNVRGGVMIGKSDYTFSNDKVLDDSAISTFLCDFYRGKGDVPREILLSFAFDNEEKDLMGEFLSALAGVRVEVKTPERGDKKALCGIAVNNAAEVLSRYVNENETSDLTLSMLSELLMLDALPARIEAYDISNLGQEHITAGMVVCEDGRMKRSDYRTFHIRGVEGTDDYASMQEAIRRRFSHLSDEDSSFGTLPDLLLLDGGKGHVSSVKEVLLDMGLDIPVFGMVKDDFHKTRSLCNETDEISIAHEQKLFVFLYQLQEEVHRYTVSRMTGAKRKTLRTSSLEKIQGIGAKKAKLLLASMGTIGAIKKAELEDLEQIKGLSHKDAMNIYRYFRNGKEEKE